MPSALTVHIRQSRKPWGRQKWYFLARAANGETLCSSELYVNRGDAVSAAVTVFSAASPVLMVGDGPHHYLRTGVA